MRPTVNSLKSLPDVITTYDWDLSFVQFPRVVGGITSDALNVRCVSAQPPTFNGQKMTVNIRGQQVHQPGLHQYNGQLQLAFIDTVNTVIQDFFRRWREACWQTNTGYQYSKRDVEATIQLIRLSRQNLPIYFYTLFGCFYQEVGDGGAMEAAGNEPANFQFVLSYDYFEDRKA